MKSLSLARLLLCAALPAALAGAAYAAGKPAQLDSITWLSGEPAAQQADGKAGARSFSEALASYLQARWPEVTHRVDHANARRAWQMIGNGEHVCQLSSVRTPEREKLAFFTDTLIGAPQQLIVRRDKLGELPRNAAGEVDLPRVMANARLRGALVDGRSYGDLIDAQLKAAPNKQSVTRYAASDFGSRMLAMLERNRADYTIGYDMSLGGDTGAEAVPASLQSVPIAGASAPLRAGVACPRNAWGLMAIHKIDALLGTPAGAAMLREQSERWLTPETRRLYGARLAEFYRDRAKPSLIR